MLEREDVLEVVEGELRGDVVCITDAQVKQCRQPRWYQHMQSAHQYCSRAIILRNQTEQQKCFGGIFS